MEYPSAFYILQFYVILSFVNVVVESRMKSALFSKAHFIHGDRITTSNGVPSVLLCLLTCNDACGFVQYTDNDTCTLYEDAALLTEPTNVAGQIEGYRKVRYNQFRIGITNVEYLYCSF